MKEFFQEEFYFDLNDVWEINLNFDTFFTQQNHGGFSAGVREEILWGTLINQGSAKGAR